MSEYGIVGSFVDSATAIAPDDERARMLERVGGRN
jgi:hypothetical protein